MDKRQAESTWLAVALMYVLSGSLARLMPKSATCACDRISQFKNKRRA